MVIDSITAILAYLQAPSGRSPWTPPCHTAHSSVSLLLVYISSGHQLGTINYRGIGVQTADVEMWAMDRYLRSIWCHSQDVEETKITTHAQLLLPQTCVCHQMLSPTKDKNPFNEQSLSSNHSACEDLNEIQTDCRQGAAALRPAT